MKGKIEAAANIVVIVLAVVVGSVFLRDRLSPPAPESEAVKAGDELPKLDGWDWSAHDQTLVLGLRKGCHFCEDSAPFYQRLTAQQQQGRVKPRYSGGLSRPCRYGEGGCGIGGTDGSSARRSAVGKTEDLWNPDFTAGGQEWDSPERMDWNALAAAGA